jgi:hypothetical protein
MGRYCNIPLGKGPVLQRRPLAAGVMAKGTRPGVRSQVPRPLLLLWGWGPRLLAPSLRDPVRTNPGSVCGHWARKPAGVDGSGVPPHQVSRAHLLLFMVLKG